MSLLNISFSENGVANTAAFIIILLCAIHRIWTGIRREIDIASGVDRQAVRKYYRKIFHSRTQKEDYRKKRMEACGCSADSGDRQILRLQAFKVKIALHLGHDDPYAWEECQKEDNEG